VVSRNSKKKLQAKQKKEKIVFFDEFAVYDRPSAFYAWAEKNSRPQVPSNERRRNKVNGLLAVDVQTGEEYLKLKQRAKTEDISSYFAELCRDCVQQGLRKLSVILDNNTINAPHTCLLMVKILCIKAKVREVRLIGMITDWIGFNI
jgi:hypothetical protein